MTNRSTGVGEFEARLTDGAGAGASVFVRLTAGHLVIENADRLPMHDVHVDDIAEVVHRGSQVEIALQRAVPIVLDCQRADQLDSALMAACCTIPELTRALRSLGSSRVRVGGRAQREFFAPLLDARRRAEESVGRGGIVRAFDPERLNRALDGYLTQLTERRADTRPAARRAFAAQAEEVAQPLRTAIAEVSRVAVAAANPSGDERVASWRRWSSALHGLFAAADHCWSALQSALPTDQPDVG